jgi:arylsulfatase
MLRLLLTALLAATAAFAAASRPNVIIIMADDVGWSDLGCFGSEIATPNLDALAAGGVRFTQFYNTARCCPTRASLLTGLYPHQAGIGHMMNDYGVDSYRGDLNQRCVTLAEVLKPAGYRTYITGKWHVTPGGGAEALKRQHNWPLQRGFDRFYGTIHGAGSFWDPSALVSDNTLITAANDPEYKPKEYYYTDAISDHATRFLHEHARDHRDQPFLLYVPYTAAHWPMHARESDIAKYHGRYDAGYEAIRTARFAKQKQLGLIPADAVLPPAAGDWGKVQNRAFEARCMEVYAAMLTVMDEGVGRIVAELKANGQFENTVICFLQDNGGCAETNGRIGPFQPRAAAPSLPRWRRARSSRTAALIRRGTVGRSAGATASCPGQPIRSSPTAAIGPTSAIRRSASTNTGCTRVASPRRSSCIGRPASPTRAAANSNASPVI